MSDIHFYNPQQRRKQELLLEECETILIRNVTSTGLAANHIKKLRQAAVLEMVRGWLKFKGKTVCLESETESSNCDIAIVEAGVNDEHLMCAMRAKHVLCVGDIQVSRTPNADEDLFCAGNYLSTYGEEVVRFFIMRTQYRTAIQFTKLQIEDAKRSLDRFYRALKAVPPAPVELDKTQPHVKRFIEAMNDDFNMLRALAAMNELANTVISTRSPTLSAQLKLIGGYLNILQNEPSTYLHRPVARASRSGSKWSFMKQMDLKTLPRTKCSG